MLSSYSVYKYIYLKLAKISGTGRKFIATPKTVTIPKLNFIKEEMSPYSRFRKTTSLSLFPNVITQIGVKIMT